MSHTVVPLACMVKLPCFTEFARPPSCSRPSSSPLLPSSFAVLNRLNNCVGRSNYRYFVGLLVSTFFMTSIQLGLSVWFFFMYHTDDADFKNRGTVCFRHKYSCFLAVSGENIPFATPACVSLCCRLMRMDSGSSSRRVLLFAHTNRPHDHM